jgi:hypothetical protein
LPASLISTSPTPAIFDLITVILLINLKVIYLISLAGSI